METYIGLTSDQFENVLRRVYPALSRIYRDPTKAENALYIYLMKLRTNQTNAQIAPLFGVNQRVISSRIRNVREIIHRDFVPVHLFNRSREDILQHTSSLSRRLYNVNENTAVVTWDGTYVYTIISSNYNFQKQTYSVHKKRNLVKFMMCVSTDGLILGAYGPFAAQKNDATILTEIMNEQGNIFENFRPGDVMVLDRGFRDCVATLQNRNFVVKIPAFTKSSSKRQLTKQQANRSRFVTKTRFVVEVRNGHIKNRWKYLKEVKIHQSVPYLEKDFQIGSALINAFSSEILSDKRDWEKVTDLMAARNNDRTSLKVMVQHIPARSFTQVNNLSLFPKLTYENLKAISQGTYQINQARSYCQMHLAANNGNFVVNICDPAECQKYCAELLIQCTDPVLLLANLPSRFVSKKKHKTYILLGMNTNGEYVLKGYCCSCKNGLRSVGCCSHTMAIIWYTLHIDHNQLRLPSMNHGRIFDRN